ncbi:HpcH/HpaI aldolase family protein [Chelativorans salis]|uniref:Aldolase/citrate lyase family protein n=1 Tax=Chelativorans salis TaxID=2978478 RepID=A0ABT2LMX1_9HYPH|nr:aldolase/citrate lyase family protein [Chelativorans sp. EGI FJ00035]MCT7375192.1 aldolase/citrate lyase family protein [Chelativorans sp. EGI FJ00035]
MRAATLADRLEAGEAILTAWSSIPDALTVEAVACLGFDAVTLDMQHGGHHEDSVLRCIVPLAFHGRHAIVRVPVGRFDTASRALDFGAEAVIAPMVNSLEDASRFAAAMKYPPRGERSWGPTIAMQRCGEPDAAGWLAGAGRHTVAFAMVETRAALSLIDDMLAVDGIDGIFLGPSDFSIAWTEGKTVDPSHEGMMEAVATIAEKTRAAGKHAAIYVVDPALVGRYHGMGYRLFALGNEGVYLAKGADNLIASARASIG